MLHMLPRLVQPREIIVRSGSVARLRFATAQNAAVLCGKQSLRESGGLEKIVSELKSGCDSVVTLDGLSGEPTQASVADLAENIRATEPDLMVAVGGGTVIDAAKVAWAFYEHPDLDFEIIHQAHHVPSLGTKCSLWAIPTTAGSGSEASVAAIIGGADGIKRPYISSEWVPTVAILDARLTESLSVQRIGMGALDAFAHCLESYCSPLSNRVTAVNSVSAAKIIVEELEPQLSNTGDLAGREGLLYAAYLGGLSQSVASTGAAHALAHALSAISDANHGAAVAAFLPAVIGRNSRSADVVSAFALAIGFADTDALIDWIIRMRSLSELNGGWTRFAEGTAREATVRIATMAQNDPCLRTNPVRLDLGELEELIVQSS